MWILSSPHVIIIIISILETLKESRTRRLKTNAHVMCDQRGEKKSNKVSRFDAFLLEQQSKKKEGNFFFSRKQTSVLFPLRSFFREREKEHDDVVCEQCEFHWTRRAR